MPAEGPSAAVESLNDVPIRDSERSGVVSPDQFRLADVADEKFGLSLNHLFRLLNERKLSDLSAIGGIEGLCNRLRTDSKAGVAADESELPGTFDRRGDVPTTTSDASAAARRSSLPRLSTRNRGLASFYDRRRAFGENRLPKTKTPSFWALMWHAFNDKLMFLLTASAVVSLALGVSQLAVASSTAARTGWIESATIIGAIFVTVTATAANDYQKNYKFQKLNQRREERWVTAIRSGRACQISVFDIVVGDLVHVEPGEVLAADGILVESFRMRCNESHLSGEADLVHKAPPHECSDGEPSDPFMYSGAIVAQGVGTYVVTAVGVNSVSGRIAMSLRHEIEVTPLQQRLARLAKHVIIVGSLVGSLYFFILFVRFLVDIAGSDRAYSPSEKGQTFLNVFMLAVTVVIIGVPEGLSLAIAVALAFATTRMLKDKLLVRLLRSSEVMGHATTICSDKTATLTCNKMTVVSGVVGYEEKFGLDAPSCASRDGDSIESFDSGTKLMGELAHDVKALLKASMVANSTAIEQDGNFLGSSTETALLKFAREHLAMGPLAEERANFQIVDLIPFNANRKYMAVIVRLRYGYRMLVKGAAEIVVNNCNGTLHNTKKHFNPRGELIVAELDDEKRAEVEATMNDYSRRLLRPIAIAFRDLESWPPIAALGAREDLSNSLANFEQVFRHQMTLVGMFAIRDPLRPAVISSIRQCQRAGVVVRMLTGDNLATAEATAMECGIYTPGGVAMDGPTFRRLTTEQIDAVVPRLQVLARSNPDDKALLVMALRRLGETVAVTGDGTNDAFALKAADVGFSMGKSGTEVAKEASSIVAMDDNFASIVKALAWGRNITEAVKKYCQVSLTREQPMWV
jgi:Ca2+-transporting ATPase